MIIILRLNRFFHKRTFHCEAVQSQLIDDENKQDQQQQEEEEHQPQHRVLSNTFQTDVVCKYKT